ncbi:DUF2125 domain-containing protein [Phaeobacter sp. HF9A]|uniref:DUF2125 domain-containing protein n=1 Tax=Phaeobacter sp. HF9A TaxID=2721561 RepID=UPI0014319D4C|nr:DUF2125 domain-containing protein [Phaeobacter sp. HF9A]NIZ14682.1 DUF2125 domain-containing protein [Phaeobacter sp. HF9A]
MSVSPLRGLGVFAPVLFLAQAAHADLTAQDVWSDWKAYMSSTGYEVTASENMSGNTLTVSDIAMQIAMDGDTVSVTLGTLDFVENGDGTVNVVMPGEFPMAFDIDADGDAVKGTLLYTTGGEPMVVSGDTSEMTYNYQAETATISLEDLEIDGEAVPAEVAAFTMTLNDFTSETVMQIGDLRNYAQTLSIANTVYSFAFNEPDGNDGATFSGAVEGLAMTGEASIPDIQDPTDVAAMLKAGMAYNGNITFKGGNSNIAGNDGSDTFAVQTTSTGGTLDMTLSPEGLAYDVTQTGATVNVEGSDIPFPISLSMEELGMNFAMPLTKSEDEQDFALGFALRDFAVPEMLWGLVDPAGELPHDPATLVVDLTGKGKLFFDLVDEEQMAAVEAGDEAPGELNALNINEILLSAAGAELTGEGAFTFDNTDLETFDGMPAPNGMATLKLVGGNALMDKLVAMGLLSEDDVMGARMMMGMFAVAAGDDTLTSRIEVNDEGHVLANGQRLK